MYLCVKIFNMKDILQDDLPVQERQVDVVHILKDGQVIMAKKELPSQSRNGLNH